MRALSLSGVLAFVASGAAQGVPRYEAVVSIVANINGSEGLWLASRSRACAAISGLAAAGSAGFGVSSVQLDPCDDRIWLGGINSNGNTTGQVNSIRINGTAAAGGVVAPSSFVQHAIVPSGSSVAGITFDDNGDPIVVSGSSRAGGVFRINRCAPGAAAVLIGQVPSGTHNAICRDLRGNLYVGMFGVGQVWCMTKNPDCTYAAPVLHGTVPVTSVSGIEWCPDSGGGQLFITTFGVVGNAIFKMPATPCGGGGVAVVASATVGSLNYNDYDVNNNDFWQCGAGVDPDLVETMTVAGVNTLVCTLGGGSVGLPSCIDVSDCVNAETGAIPDCPARGSLICLDLSTCCNPGDLAVIHLISPVSVPIIIAPVGPNGRLSVKFNVTLPPGFPAGALVFASACVSATGLNIGPFKRWPGF